MADTVKLKGEVKITVVRKDGTVRLTQKIKNLVMNLGLEDSAKLLAGVAVTRPTHIAIGDGGADPAGGQTTLQGTESDRQTAAWTQAGPVATLTTTTLGAGLVGTVTVREGGLFNAGAAGTMFARFLTNVFTLDPDERIKLEWAVTFSG